MGTKQFAAIFDMDGTMIDNTRYHFKSWQAMFKKYNKGPITEETYKSEISGVPIRDTLKGLFADADDTALQALLREKEGFYKEFYGPYVTPVIGLENLLTELKDSGVKLAIASSATIADINFILSYVPVRQYFDVIIDGNRVSKGKPNPQIFLQAAADLDIRPEDCVVFEDSLADIKAGNAAGMIVVAITTGHAAGQLQPSSLVITDFTDVSYPKLETLFEQRSDER